MADIEFFDEDAGYGRGPQRGGYAYGEAARAGYGGQDGYGAAPAPEGAGLGRMVNWAGALVSLGLVVGMSVWAWQLTMRDVSGVPVIRALEGPMRVVPDNPGGAQAPHQGLAVNRIAEGSEAEPVPDRLVLAPPPVDLEALDLAPPPANRAEGASAETQALIDRLLERDAVPLDPVSPGNDTAEAEPASAPEAPVAAAGAPAILPASVPGVSRSLRPLVRPADLDTSVSSVSSSASTASGQSAATATQTGGVTELTLADLSEGTRLVQLGAFDSADIARAEWDRLAARFPDFFAGRARIVQQASSGGQDFFRLRAHGFDDLDASRRFCAAMVAQGAACIPVTIR